MGFKSQKQNPPNPPQDSPVPHTPRKQTPRQPTPGPSGTQCLEDLFCGKKPHLPFLILTFASSELTLPPFVKPSQHNEPPIPGPVNPPNHMRMLHLAGLNLRWLPSCPATPTSIIIIDDTRVGSPLPPLLHWFLPQRSLPAPPRTLAPSSPHSHNEAHQEFTDLKPTLMIP
ncbi:hypothetical protein O181_006814 [Austropuccinia psidii MF-1]|uniref:Uncharacterized protein n=1 Tax=Austropuccinia psidii MF-1 TaxID=1389203 RepID=A0A9Q3BJV3_9BASI|nr:hypothetical protein [Austropuccinia psidii MF-1]